MAEHYDFDLLDIDRDGDNDWDDLKHLGRFLYAAESGNPWNIGEPLAPPIRAALSPSPSELDLVADGTWHRLDLSSTIPRVDGGDRRVQVTVTPGLRIRSLPFYRLPGGPATRSTTFDSNSASVPWVQ